MVAALPQQPLPGGTTHMDVNSREQTEREIRAAFDAGDLNLAAGLLMQRYGSEMFRFLLSRLRDEDAATEAFSTFSEDLWRGFAGFRWQCSARVWAYTLARHAASRYIADAQRRRAREAPLPTDLERLGLEAQVRTQTLAALRTEARARIDELRDTLPLDDQTLLILRVSRQLTWREIAAVMAEDTNITDATLDQEAVRLRKRFQLVKERLRKLAGDAGIVRRDDSED
jgi:RNA polymerase sigma-70 factor (ECF subfamily)